MHNDVILEQINTTGVCSLNRPKALHTLNLNMCEAMLNTFTQWQNNEQIELVLLKHAEGRGFCAGGDIRSMYDSVDEGGKYSQDFFFTEYQLNHLIFHFRKNTIALMDGITMGGGVGIALPCKYRVATERTRFAMPETGIGLFPDVGGAWYLPRLPNNIGTYMTLTGDPVKGINCLKLGLATHYVPSEKLPDLEKALLAHPEQIETILNSYCESAGETEFDGVVEFCQQHLTGFDIKSILSRIYGIENHVAKHILDSVALKSPISTLVSMKALELGMQSKTFDDEMQREYVLACNLTAYPDFKEGVRALLIDKDNRPKWVHSSIDAVEQEEVDGFFSNEAGYRQWQPA